MKRGSADCGRLVSFCSAKRGATREVLVTLLEMGLFLIFAIIIGIIIYRVVAGGGQ